jgi:hypothetical protein
MYRVNPILHTSSIRTCLEAWTGAYAKQHFLLFFKNILAFESYKKGKDNVTKLKVCIIFLYSVNSCKSMQLHPKIGYVGFVTMRISFFIEFTSQHIGWSRKWLFLLTRNS